MASLLDEVLNDIAQLRELAVQSATNELLEATLPRIKELAEAEIFGALRQEEENEEEQFDIDMKPANVLATVNDQSPLPLISADVNASNSVITDPVADEIVDANVSLPSIPDATPIDVTLAVLPSTESPVNVDSCCDERDDDEAISYVETFIISTRKKINECMRVSPTISKLPSYKEGLTTLVKSVEDMYEYVQKRNAAEKFVALEEGLEDVNSKLMKLLENKMKRKRINEGDVTLKLTGLPDELDLESIGVDLITGEEDESTGEEDVDGIEDVSEEGEEDAEGSGDDLDLSDIDLDSDDEEESEEKLEAVETDDDEIVEIDEAMLHREISKMKTRLSEINGNEFGGGKECCDALKTSVKDAAKVKKLTKSSEPVIKEPKKSWPVAESTRINHLRRQLVEANLANAKLTLTNAILVNESFTQTEKARLIQRLRGTKTLAEAKQLYLAATKRREETRSVNESVDRRQILSSASTPTKSGGASQLNESVQVDRWAKLAGIR